MAKKAVPSGNALADAAGPLKELLSRLSGSAGGTWLMALNRLLRGENPWDGLTFEWETWTEIEIGGDGYRSLESLIVHGRYDQEYWDLIQSMSLRTLPYRHTAALVRVRVGELGFTDGATLHQIFCRAKAVGLRPCDQEIPARLREAYMNQPLDECLWIGTERMSAYQERKRIPGIFALVHTAVKDSHSSHGSLFQDHGPLEDGTWPPEAEFVFMKSLIRIVDP